MKEILKPIKVGNIELKNRLMFPPLTTAYEEADGSMSQRAIDFYERLAIGGTGYIVLGDVAPCKSLSPTPKLYSDDQIESFKKFTSALQRHGAKVGAQVFHSEYNPEEILEMFKDGNVAAVREKIHHDMENYCNDISLDRIKEIQTLMINCAIRCAKAGFDVIQIHGDRLLGMFCSPLMNKREDHYGGSLENRARFTLEIVKGIKDALPDMTIEYKLTLIRMNPRYGKGGPTEEEGKIIAKWLEEAGVHMIHVCQANHTDVAETLPPMGIQPYGCFSEMAAEIKKCVNIPVSAVGRIVTPQHAEMILQTGKADIVAVGRPLLADADWIKKIEEGTENTIRGCIMCNKGCTDKLTGRGIVGCVLNAENGYEASRVITKANTAKNVAIIGGGIAGLEAARVSALKGHKVTVFEKSTKLGGQILIAQVPPRKDEMARSIHYFENTLVDNENVDFVLGKTATAKDLLKYNPDHVIIATGAQNISLKMDGADNANVLNAWKVLDGTQVCSGKVAIIGGGLVGAETAEFLAESKECAVSIIEMTDTIAKEESMSIRPTMLKHFKEKGVNLLTEHKLIKINKNSITCLDKDEKEIEVPADFVVMAVGARPVAFDTAELEANNIPFSYVGDCKERVADIENAIKTAYDAANAI